MMHYSAQPVEGILPEPADRKDDGLVEAFGLDIHGVAESRLADTFNVANWCYTRVATNRPDHTVELGQLWPYHKERKLYWCPLDRTNNSFFRQREMKVCSYMMNGAVSGYSTGPRGPYTTYKLTQFQPHYMVYWEADEKQPSNWDNVASEPNEGVTQRHNTGSVMGMFGGQTEFMKFKAYALEAGIGGYRGVRPGRFWCNPGSATGEGP